MNTIGADHGYRFCLHAQLFGNLIGHVDVISTRGHTDAHAAEGLKVLRHGKANGAARENVAQGICEDRSGENGACGNGNRGENTCLLNTPKMSTADR